MVFDQSGFGPKPANPFAVALARSLEGIKGVAKVPETDTELNKLRRATLAAIKN